MFRFLAEQPAVTDNHYTNFKAAVNSGFVIDFRRQISFVSLLELSNKFEEINPAQTIDILVNDRDTISDICKILPHAAYEITIRKDKGDADRIRIKKVVAHYPEYHMKYSG